MDYVFKISDVYTFCCIYNYCFIHRLLIISVKLNRLCLFGIQKDHRKKRENFEIEIQISEMENTAVILLHFKTKFTENVFCVVNHSDFYSERALSIFEFNIKYPD